MKLLIDRLIASIQHLHLITIALAAIVTTSLIVALPASTAANDQQGAKAWAAGLVFVDAGMFQYGRLDEMASKLAALPSRRPVLIFLHGCDGLYDLKRGPPQISNLFSGYYRLLTRANALGYVVVAPDSFATERSNNCPGKPDRYGQRVHSLREAELAYAMAQVKAMPWADANRIVLFGHSEGGRSVLRYGGTDVRGVLSTGWSCGTAQPAVAANMPVLNIKAGNDPVDTNRQRCYFHAKEQQFVDPLDGRHVPGEATWSTYIEPFLKQLLVAN